MAASLQRERDSAKTDAAKAEQENQTLSAKVADLARQLSSASSQIKSLSKDGDSSKDGGSSKDCGSPRQEGVSMGKGKVKNEAGTSQQEQAEAVGTATVVTQAHAQDAALTPAQVRHHMCLLVFCF